jgi:hypothetical protein
MRPSRRRVHYWQGAKPSVRVFLQDHGTGAALARDQQASGDLLVGVGARALVLYAELIDPKRGVCIVVHGGSSSFKDEDGHRGTEGGCRPEWSEIRLPTIPTALISNGN